MRRILYGTDSPWQALTIGVADIEVLTRVVCAAVCAADVGGDGEESHGASGGEGGGVRPRR